MPKFKIIMSKTVILIFAKIDSDDETSSDSSSLPSEITDEFPVRVDRNLNHLDKHNGKLTIVECIFLYLFVCLFFKKFC